MSQHPEWTRDWAEVIRLLYWLEASGRVTTVEEAISVAEKPWKYEAEHAEMVAFYAQAAA